MYVSGHDIQIKNLSGPLQVLKLFKHNLRWTMTRDVLNCLIIYLTEQKCRNHVWEKLGPHHDSIICWTTFISN